MDREALKQAGVTIAGDIKGHEHFVEWFVERRDSVDKLPENYVVARDDYYANYKTHKKEGSKLNKNVNQEYIPVVGGLVEASKIGRDEPDVFYRMLVKDTDQYRNALYGNVHDISCEMLFVRSDKKQLRRRVFQVNMKVQGEYYDLVHNIKKTDPEADANTRLFLMANKSVMQHNFGLKKIKQNVFRVSKKKYDYEKRKKQATPIWANHFKINAIYRSALKLNKRDGKNTWHVDHIFPLKYRGIYGEEGSGLHIHQNLKIILAKDNLKKSNRRVG